METKTSIIRSALRHWSDGPKYVLIDSEHYSSEISTIFLEEQTFFKEYFVIDSYGRTIQWVKYFPHHIGCIVVISNRDYADDMQKIRPDLEVRKIMIPKEEENVRRSDD